MRLRPSPSPSTFALCALLAFGCVPAGMDPRPSGTGGAGAGDTGGRGGSNAGSGGAAGGTGGSGTAGAGGAGGAGTGGAAGSGGNGGASSNGGQGGAGGVAGGVGSDASPRDLAAPQETGSGPRDGAAPAEAGGNPGGMPFSFFVTSIEAMRKLSNNQNGFGGNLGGLTGADKICQDIAAQVDAGAGQKTWRAFLSAVKGPDGQPVHAIDRIGNGPWYDKNGRLVAMDRAGLLRGPRPAGTAQAVVDLANERGQTQKQFGDNHDVITASNKMGMLNSTDPSSTCNDWTSAAATAARGLMCGHSWSRTGSQNWLSEHTVPGCAPGVNLRDNTVMQGNCIGCNGGYGAIYCFALSP
jgi:hypothetical protein